jgi:hypothetical protein
MATISDLAKSTHGWRVLPPVRLRDIDYPDGARVTMRGDALEVRRPDGSVLAGTVGMWGVAAYQDDDGNVVIATDPQDPEVSVTIAGIEPEELLPGSHVWVETYPVA